jgi:hypothetical protein
LRNALSVDQDVSSKARRAAAMAASMSSAPAADIAPSTVPVAGLTLAKVSPERASRRRPSTSIRDSARCATRSLSAALVGSAVRVIRYSLAAFVVVCRHYSYL